MTPEERADVEIWLKRIEQLNAELAELETSRRNIEKLRQNGRPFPEGAEERYQRGMNVLLRHVRQVEDWVTDAVNRT